MATRSLRLSWAALLSGGALAVHQARYLLAHGGDADHALTADGHAYLPLVAWPIAVAVGSVGAMFLAALAAPTRDRFVGSERGLAKLWAQATAVLLVVYAGQELVEGALAPGHAGGLAAVVGDGGWSALPAALVVGGAVAGLAHTGRLVLRLRPRPAATVLRLRPAAASAIPVAVDLPSPPALAGHRAGRAPPSAS